MSTLLYVPMRAGFTVSVGTHVQTTRASYTVPANSIAEIEHVFLRLAESTAVALSAAGIFLIVPSMRILQIDSLNAIGIRYGQLSAKVLLSAGETVTIDTVNSSATTLVFLGALLIKEYK